VCFHVVISNLHLNTANIFK